MARLAPSLIRGRAVIDARWPHRDRSLDGWIGDEAHQGRVSDHNPNTRNLVDAIDVDMYSPASGQQVHRQSIVAGAIVHPAVHYVIFARRIYSRDDAFQPREYHGINGHLGHCHVSISQTVGAENAQTPWALWHGFPSWSTMNLSLAHRTEDVVQLQAYLNAWGASLRVDGDFGPKTDEAVRAFQTAHDIVRDGVVGPVTRSRLFGG